ncbi:MAG: efflux RND transporter periplasmic adaptor subunit [Verrucomicrobiales bacterium]|nr:efflux RND transporter periplasmic adaptor subunit [Verrucomicrobiales bacterium]
MVAPGEEKPVSIPDPPAPVVKHRIVRGIQVSPAATRIRVESGGFVRAETQSGISAEVAGKIVEVSDRFFPGEFFRKGDLLLKIDPSDYETAAKIAKSNVSMREKLLKEEERLSEEAIDKWKDRYGRSKTPPADVARETQLTVARTNLDVAKAELESAETKLGRTEVRAPFNALLMKKHADMGQFVTPGMVVAALASVDFAEVRVPLELREVKLLKLPVGPAKDAEGKGGSVVIRGANGERRAAMVRTENVIDESTRSLYAVARVDDPYLWISEDNGGEAPVTLGEYVSVEMESEAVENLVELPREALRNERELVLVSNQKSISVRQVEVVHETKDHIYVRGLNQDDIVVLTSPHLAYEGEKVEVIMESLSEGEQ